MNQPAPIENLLQDLRSRDAYRGKTAAEQFGKLMLNELDEPAEDRIVDALQEAAQKDKNQVVQAADPGRVA